MRKRYQHYAIDVNGNWVHIKDAEKSMNHIYRCPICNDIMICKQGDIRDWHYAHKTKQCDYNQYLHTLAKHLLCKWFNENEVITLNLRPWTKCSHYDKCPWKDSGYSDCRFLGNKMPINLKKWFDNSVEEKGFVKNDKHFVADIFCQNKNNPNNPLFLEIFVTHECEQIKKDSGIKIIEFKIESEVDIHYIMHHPIEESEKIRFYNFNPKDTLSDSFEGIPMQKFILFHSGKAFVDRDRFTCKNYNQQRIGLAEVTIEYDGCIPYFLNEGGFFPVANAAIHKISPDYKSCYLCKWSVFNDWEGKTICKLYKSCNTSKYCKDNNPNECNYYHFDDVNYTQLLKPIKEREKDSTIDIWIKE